MSAPSRKIRFVLLTAVFLAALPVLAKDPPPPSAWGRLLFLDDSQPVKISSDRLEFDSDSESIHFSGNVWVRQPDLQLKADRLTVFSDSEGRILTLEAEGHLRVYHEKWEAKARRLRFDRERQMLHFTGEPQIRKGKQVIEGESIRFLMKERKIVVDKARADLHPTANKPPSATPKEAGSDRKKP